MKEKDKKALALRYSHNDKAPKVIARGKNLIAEEIIKLANENDVTIYQDKNLVELLYKEELGKEIPLELYEAVAKVLSFVYLANEKYHEYLVSSEK